MTLDLHLYCYVIKTMQWHQSFNKGLWEQQNGTSVTCHPVILSSKVISKSLLKCLPLEASSDLLFRRFIPWCAAISNFSFKQRLHLSIAWFIGVFLWKFHFFFILLVVKWFFMIGESFFKSIFTTFPVMFVTIKFIWIQTGLINNIFDLAFSG